MDRLQFSESIGIDPTIQVKQYFSEIMGMYNLFGEYKNISITSSVADQKISFILIFKSEKESKDMHNLVHEKKIQIYDNMYTIYSELNKKKLNLRLTL